MKKVEKEPKHWDIIEKDWKTWLYLYWAYTAYTPYTNEQLEEMIPKLLKDNIGSLVNIALFLSSTRDDIDTENLKSIFKKGC